jgi:class 3 adenylate cyclase
MDLLSRRSAVRYARAGDDAQLAYRVIEGAGSGTRDVVLVLAGTMSMEALFEDPVALRFVDGLTDLGRIVIFDRCGIGLSDPPADSEAISFARWCDDVEAVVAAAQVVRPVLVGSMAAPTVEIMYCDRHPDDVTSAVLINPAPIRFDRSILRAQLQGDADSVALWCPSRADEPGFREWFNRAGQLGASPRLAERAYPPLSDDEVREIKKAASRVRVPTLVLRRPAHPLCPPPASDPIMALVPGAVRVDLPGEDLPAYGSEVDALMAEVFRFVTGEHHLPAPERILAAVLYSDLVASTDRTTALGDARWRRVLDRHDEIALACVGRRGGTVIKTTGDGVLAILPSATNALRAARELRAALLEQDLEVRVGIHVADIDRRGDDISGVGAVIAARILNLAAPGEILVSTAAVSAATGEPIQFEPRGEHHLKGIPGTWPIFAAQ